MAVRGCLRGHRDTPSGRAVAVIFALFFVSASFLTIQTHPESNDAKPLAPLTDETAVRALDSIGGYFIENRGQVNDLVKYYSTGNPTVAFRDDGVMFVVRKTVGGQRTSMPPNPIDRFSEAGEEAGSVESLAYIVRFEGANRVSPVGVDRLGFSSNFFIGNNPDEWRTGVWSYREVVYEGLYEGVDLVYRMTEEGVKYDFIIGPGTDMSSIKMSYEGADGVVLAAAGDLLIHTAIGDIADSAPTAHQGRDDVECSFVLHVPDAYGFVCNGVDESREVVIDPLIYSTYLGGGASEFGYSIATDSAGNAYVTGGTGSADFPVTPGAFDSILNAADTFVAKLDSDGSSLLYSTYLGGGDIDEGYSIATDSAGNAYVTGGTYSSDFPVTPGAFDATLNGSYDAFVAKLDSMGSSLLYSIYLGGSLGGCGGDVGYSIAINSTGNAYVTGFTWSTDFPVTLGAFDTTFNGYYDAFVTKLDFTGSSLLYSTYLGGGGEDYGRSIETDSAGNAYVAGYTGSEDFSVTPGAFDPTYNGPWFDAFVAKLDFTGSSLLYSTYLGGGSEDIGYSIAIDSDGNAYVTGFTWSTDFPVTPGAFDATLNGSEDSFVAKVDSTGSSLLYSTYLGGSGWDDGRSIALDSAGNAYVTGITVSTDFPVTPGAFDATLNGSYDAFVAKLNSTGISLSYSTYLGGDGEDRGYSIATDSAGNAYVAGFTWSADFPVTPGAFDATYNGWYDAFVAKLWVYFPPSASGLGVQGFTSSPGILHITDVTPDLNWTYSDPDGDQQTRYWVMVGTMYGGAEMWDPGQQAGDATSMTYAGAALQRGVNYFFGVAVYDGFNWSSFFEVVFRLNSIPNPPTLPVTPGNASVIGANPAQTMSWTSGGDPDTGDVITFEWQVSTDGAFVTIVASGTISSTTSSTFSTSPSTIYYWRVRAHDDWETSTWSAYGNTPPGYWTFSTSPPPNTRPTMAITHPSGGEVFYWGSSPTVTWMSSDAQDPTTALTFWINYTSSAGSGAVCGPRFGVQDCDWSMPSITAADVILNGTVIDTGGLKGYDESGPFAIMPPPNTPPTISIASPSGGEVWIQGSSHTVTWIASDNEDASSALLVWINYTSSAGDGSICGPVAGNLGYCSWTLPTITATDVVVNGTVVDTGDLRGFDDSGQFTIKAPQPPPPPNAPPTATITSPVGGEEWLKGSSHAITWTMHDDEDIEANLTIYINYTTGGAANQAAMALKGDVSFEWTLPAIEANDVVVNITVIDTGGLRGWDESGPFRIVKPPPPSSVEANYKPLVALAFATILAVVGLWSSKKRPGKGGKDRMAVMKAFAVTSLPFVMAEAVTGVVSFLTGQLSMPPLFGVGTAVDLAILLAGVVTAILRTVRTKPSGEGRSE